LTKREIQEARENTAETLYKIGWDYYSNKKDYTKAFMWLHKAALENHDKAQFQVGYLFQHGLGVPQGYKLAMQWYQKAAKNGNTDAQFNIGYMYRHGLGVPRNYKLAMEWYQKAASNGNNSDQSNIGYLYHYGLVVSQDYKLFFCFLFFCFFFVISGGTEINVQNYIKF
jgi:TPR repeat protein